MMIGSFSFAALGRAPGLAEEAGRGGDAGTVRRLDAALPSTARPHAPRDDVAWRRRRLRSDWLQVLRALREIEVGPAGL